MALSHVPKFGNWDNDNVPYTAYFEHARKEKSGTMVNPNDPMKNPEAFNTWTRVGENVDADEVMGSHSHHSYSHSVSSLESGNHTHRHHVHHRSRGSQGSFTAEFASEQSHFDHKRSITKGGTSIKRFSSPSHNGHKSKSSSFNDQAHHHAAAIPKFGTWDVTNPQSGEGYTAIFTKIKEEKQTTSRQYPSISHTPPLNNCSNIKNQNAVPSSSLSKYCCCLFPGESK
ncbi:RPM1-interacting protein 4-like isoform X2 [Cajanus cajan]|uniref:RPM1-interacting protein 4-like isoform X2 n=1 Tax=Cajanus cajan TaxID=3821 RepID=UPI0010FB74FD|nr:RPM1-interacting protein 4-like isoform X2 [Cajanus cajan]